MNLRRSSIVLTITLGLAAAGAACSDSQNLNAPSPLTSADATAPGAQASRGSGGSENSGSGSGSGGGSNSIRVRCEIRSGRSKVSVDGNNLPSGRYVARVQSGGNVATSNPRATVGDEVEFDFDSARDDIAAGATPIAASFLASGRATGQIRSAAGAVVASATVQCRSN